MSGNVKVGIEYELLLDKFAEGNTRAVELMKQFGTGATAAMGGMTSAALTGSRARTTALQQEGAAHTTVQRSITQSHSGELQKRQSAEANFRKYKAQLAREELESNADLARKSTSAFRTYNELETQYSTVKTKKLVADTLELVIARRKAEEDIKAAIKSGDAVAKASAEGRVEALSQELKSLRLLTIQRDEVQKEGAGAVLGQLGVGRNITNLFSTVQSMFGSSPIGFGGPAMLQTAAAGSKLIPILGAIGPAALASIGGVAGFTFAMKELVTTGIDANQILSKQRTAFEQAGVAPKNMNAEMERSDRLAMNLSARWNVSSDSVRKLTTDLAFLGRVHGETADKVVTLSVAIEKMTKGTEGQISASQVMKAFEFADPEHEANIARLSRAFPDLADNLKNTKSQAEELSVAWRYLDPLMKGLDREARSSDEALERAATAWGELKRAASLAAVDALEPELDLVSQLSTAVNKNAGNVHEWTAAFIASLPYLGTVQTNVRQLNDILGNRAAAEATGEYAGLKNMWSMMPGPLSVLSSILPGFTAEVQTSGNVADNAAVKFNNASNSITGFIQHMAGLRTGADEGIAAILINQDRMKNGWKDQTGAVHRLTDAERQQYEAANQGWDSRLRSMSKYLKEYDDGHKKLSIKYGLEEAAKSPKGAAHAFSSVVEERARHLSDLHQLNLLSNDDEIRLLESLLATVKGMKVKDRDEQLKAEAGLQAKLDTLRKSGIDQEKKDTDESGKQTKEDLDAVTEAYNSATQKRIAALQDAAARGKDIKRDELLVEIDNAVRLLDIANHQGQGVAAAETRLNGLRDQLRLLDIKADYDQGKKRIQIQQEIEDRLAALISDPKKREARQAELKYLRDKDKISEITDATQKYDLTLANETEYQRKLLDIKESSAREQQKITQDILHSGIDPLNQALMKSIDLWAKSGGLAGQVLGDMLKKLLSIGETKLLDSIFSGDKKEASSKPFDPIALLKSVTGMVPSFNDSNGPVGQAGGPIVNGKALVLADPMDWLVKLPLNNGAQPLMMSGGEGETAVNPLAPSPKRKTSDEKTDSIIRSLKQRQQLDSKLFNMPSFEGGQKAETGQEATAIGAFLTHFKTKNDAWQHATIKAMVDQGISAEDIIDKVIELGKEQREKFGEKVKAGMVEIGAVTLSAGMSLSTTAGGVLPSSGSASGSFAVDATHDLTHAAQHNVDSFIAKKAIGFAGHTVPHAVEHFGGELLAEKVAGESEGGEAGHTDVHSPSLAEGGAGSGASEAAAMGALGKVSTEFTKLAKTGDHAADSTKKVTDSTKQSVGTMLSLGTTMLGLIPGGGIAASLLGTFGSALGFAEGDYTGDGDPKQVAGPAHKKEFYFDHKTTARFGVTNLRALKAGNPMPLLRSMGIPPVSLIGLPGSTSSNGGGGHYETAMAISTLHGKLDAVVQAIQDKETLSPGQIYGAMQHTAGGRSQRGWKR
jgi:hypothetical protein